MVLWWVGILVELYSSRVGERERELDSQFLSTRRNLKLHCFFFSAFNDFFLLINSYSTKLDQQIELCDKCTYYFLYFGKFSVGLFLFFSHFPPHGTQYYGNISIRDSWVFFLYMMSKC